MTIRLCVPIVLPLILLASCRDSKPVAPAPRGTLLFQSEAQIRFSPAGEIAGRHPNASDFAMMQLFGSGTETTLALQEPAWRETNKGNSEEELADFSSKLIIEQNGDGLVTITCVDEDEATALAAVKSVISSYKKIYSKFDPENLPPVLKLLNEDRVNLENQLALLNDQRKQIWGDDATITPESLQKSYDAKMDELAKAEVAELSAQLDADVLRTQMTPGKPGMPIGPPDPASINQQKLEELKQIRDKYKAFADETKAQAKDLADKVRQLQQIQKQSDDIKRRLADINVKYDQLNSEYQNAVRATFLSDGEKAGRALFEFKNNHWTKLPPEK